MSKVLTLPTDGAACGNAGDEFAAALTGLLVVLAALAALLGASVWRDVRGAGPPARTAAAPSSLEPASGATVPGRTAAVFTGRVSLALALGALALAVMLIFSQALHSSRTEARPQFTALRAEMNTLANLARSSAAQGEELTRERGARQRVEEDVQLKQQLLTQSLEEKIRLGRDLHDGIIQSLYAVGLTLESVRELVKTDPAEADRRLERTRAGLNETIRDVRAYITGLSPENLRRAGFARALEALLAEFQTGRDARFEVAIDGDAAALLSAEQSLQALQIAREAVSNALRHGGATVLILRMHKSENEVCLLIQDNGSGFNPEAPRDGGHGLHNMKARAAHLGANLRITSQPGEGSRVLATLPIVAPTAV
jgi:signal transduction histidine kinase